MSVRPRKLAELPSANSLSSGDLLIVEKTGSSPITSKMTAENLRKQIIRGPFANDAAANTAGILIGEAYYISSGEVRVRVV